MAVVAAAMETLKGWIAVLEVWRLRNFVTNCRTLYDRQGSKQQWYDEEIPQDVGGVVDGWLVDVFDGWWLDDWSVELWIWIDLMLHNIISKRRQANTNWGGSFCVCLAIMMMSMISIYRLMPIDVWGGAYFVRYLNTRSVKIITIMMMRMMIMTNKDDGWWRFVWSKKD